MKKPLGRPKLYYKHVNLRIEKELYTKVLQYIDKNGGDVSSALRLMITTSPHFPK